MEHTAEPRWAGREFPRVAYARGLFAFVCLLILLLSSLLLDDSLAEWMARPIRSGQLRNALRSLRLWGEGINLALLTVGLALAQPKRAASFALILAGALLAGGIVDQIKPFVRRPRPSEAVALRADPNYPWPGGRNSSFPSGHTASAFAYARGMSLLYPPLEPLFLIAAGGTAMSRMYEQRHYLSDCVAGAAIGWSVMSLLAFGSRRISKSTFPLSDLPFKTPA